MLAQGSRQYQCIWNAMLLTIAHFPASSNLDRTLVCFLLWPCLVISFLCLLGLACLMKLCSLETPEYTPVSIWYCFGWYMEFLLGLYPNQMAALWGESAQKTGMSPLHTEALQGKRGQGDLAEDGICCLANAPGVSPPCSWGGKLEEHLNLWRGATAVSWMGCVWPLACALAGKAGLSGTDTFSPACVRGPVVLCRHLLQAPTCPPQP